MIDMIKTPTAYKPERAKLRRGVPRIIAKGGNFHYLSTGIAHLKPITNQ